jgi:hypothetical protein
MKIFTPVSVPLPPDAIDGVESLLTKGGRTQTQSTAFVTLRQVDLVPGLFSIPNARLKIEFVGRTLGALGNKNIRIQLDGGASLYDSSAIAMSNALVDGHMCVFFDGSQIFSSSVVRIASAYGLGSGVTAHALGGPAAPITFDPNVAHALQFQALVVNAADTFILDWLGASFR